MVGVIFAVGAHPDDFEIGCGGVLRKFINRGAKAYGVVLTKGENGQHAPDCHECNDAAKILGLRELFLLEFTDGKLNDDSDVVSAIGELIKKYEPERIYVHCPNDTHQDHRNACRATISAAKRLIPNIYKYQSPTTEPGFIPVKFSVITETLEDKIKALKCYQTQIVKNTVLSLDWVRAQAIYWGDKARTNDNYNENMDRAEAFEIYREVER